MSQAGNGSAIAILGDPVTVDHGGTGQTSLTAGALLYGDGTNPVGLLGPLTDGQLAIGDTAGVNPVAASLTAPAAGITITGGAGSITFALADDLAALEALASTGLAARTAASTWAVRTLQQPAAGITIADADGVAGDPTFALANDLAALENLGGVGYPVRFAPDSWTTRTFQNGSDGSITVTNGNGVTNNTSFALSDRVRMQGAYFENLGCSLSAGVFTIHAADGNSLSATNPGIVVLPSQTTPGTFIKYVIESDQSFEDAAGTSEIIGNLFGFTTSVAIAVDVPFFIYAVSNDDEDTIQFMICRHPHRQISPVSTDIGAPDDAVANSEEDFWSFDNLDETVYDENPCLCVGSFRMQMDGTDDWTIQTLASTDGIGVYQETTLFTCPLGQFGGDSGALTHPNGGTSAVFSTIASQYFVQRSGWFWYNVFMSGDAGTDGSGAVSAYVLVPFKRNATNVNITGNGNGSWAGGAARLLLFIMNPTDNTARFTIDNVSAGVQWGAFTNGTRAIAGQFYFKLLGS